MLPKKRKLTEKDFSSLKKRGKALHSPNFSLTVYETVGGKPAKFSFVVSKKVSKKSVARNKLKRIGYEAVRHLLPRIKKDGVFCIFFLKTGSEKTQSEQLYREIFTLLYSAGLLL